MHHEVHARDAELVERALDERGVAAHVVFEVARLVGLSEAGHVHRRRAAELAHGVH